MSQSASFAAPKVEHTAGPVPQFGIFNVTASYGQTSSQLTSSIPSVLQVTAPSGHEVTVNGFVAKADGSVVKARFMPKELGIHHWVASFPGAETPASGSFAAEISDCPGMLEADGWNFRWSGSRTPFFYNSTTAYLLAGLTWDTAQRALRRFARLGVNRIRLSLSPSRQNNGGRWMEPQVGPREDFSYHYGPWPARNPESQENPDFDTARFDMGYWDHYEAILTEAKRLGIVVQVIFFTDAQEPQNYPFNRDLIFEDPAEVAYYKYAVDRLAAFSNVEWCITNEWALFRPDEWVEKVGTFLAAQDRYQHLLSVHGHGHFPFRASPWCTHALFQVWDEDGAYNWMVEKRAEQAATGIIKPQINEEYGYEDHYPVPWGNGRVAPARNADSRRKLAWEITMAGGHQTTGESAENGLGGWINGLGDDSMRLFNLMLPLKRLFETYPLRDLQPAIDPNSPLRVLETPGKRRIVYAPAGEPVPAEWLNNTTSQSTYCPRTGQWNVSTIEGEDLVTILEY